jgi:hypothetical protein
MFALAHALFGVEFDHGTLGEERHDARHPELGGLLHDEIHALAARDALQQRDLQRRLAFDIVVRENLRRDALASGRLERRRELPSGAIEQGERRARRKAQDARQMLPRLRGQHDLGTLGECAGHMDSGHAHASSMPSVATRASNSISSGAMT